MAVISDYADTRLILLADDGELHLLHVDRDSNEIRLIFASVAEAREVLATLIASRDLGMAATLPDLRL